MMSRSEEPTTPARDRTQARLGNLKSHRPRSAHWGDGAPSGHPRSTQAPPQSGRPIAAAGWTDIREVDARLSERFSGTATMAETSKRTVSLRLYDN
uniref:Uncharacterized protein n=1 Tax=Trichuris muris TaxID=70415 RepID=A0A5S6R4R7_TRIMR